MVLKIFWHLCSTQPTTCLMLLLWNWKDFVFVGSRKDVANKAKANKGRLSYFKMDFTPEKKYSLNSISLLMVILDFLWPMRITQVCRLNKYCWLGWAEMPKFVKQHGLMKNMLDWGGIPRYTLALDTLIIFLWQPNCSKNSCKKFETYFLLATYGIWGKFWFRVEMIIFYCWFSRFRTFCG
jgi:hypothetical protein